MERPARFSQADALRGVAILMVMLYHSITVYPVNLHEIAWCRDLHSLLWEVQMPLFFFVSGFCFSFSGSYGRYIVKKARRILVPHFVFSFLDISLRVFPNPLIREHMSLKEALWDLFIYGGGDWFLWVLFVLFAVFPALDALIVRGISGEICALLVGVAAFVMNRQVTNLFLLDMAAHYLVFMVLGRLVRRHASQLPFIRPDIPGRRAGGPVFCFLKLCGDNSLTMYLFDAYAVVLTRTVITKVMGITHPVPIILGNFIPDVIIVLFISVFIVSRVKVFRFVCGMG